jgi:hypothetical protein
LGPSLEPSSLTTAGIGRAQEGYPAICGWRLDR